MTSERDLKWDNRSHPNDVNLDFTTSRQGQAVEYFSSTALAPTFEHFESNNTIQNGGNLKTTIDFSTQGQYSSLLTTASDLTTSTMLPRMSEFEVTFHSTEGILTTTSNTTDNRSALFNGTCEDMYQTFLKEMDLFLTPTRVTKIILTWIIFVLSMAGNSFVLYSLTCGRRRRRMSHAQIMMFHLTCANLIFTAIILPTDAIWNTTVQWYGGEFLCRIINVLKQFAMYISSAVIVVMGVDRAAGLMFPVSTETKRRRMKKLFRIAWGFSLCNAIPAGVLFSVIHHYPMKGQCPDYYFTQCVDYKLINGPQRWPYLLYTWFASFFGPLICILLCYIFIALSISKMARISKRAESSFTHRQQSSTKRSLDRARRISQLVVALITATFILCWAPYYVVGFIDWFWVDVSKGGNNILSPVMYMLLLMSMYLSPCLHPIITILLTKEVRTNIKTQLTVSKSSIIHTFRISNNGAEKHRQPHQQPRINKPRQMRRTVVKNCNKDNDTEVILMNECRNGLLVPHKKLHRY